MLHHHAATANLNDLFPVPRNPEPTFIEKLVYRRPPYFWWMLALILVTCFTILSWTLCYTIFNAPEVPRHYQIMKKLGRLPVHEDYSTTTPPQLATYSPEILRNKFLALDDKELKKVNQSIMRSYLTNFRENTFCSYVQGRYKVLESRPLDDSDFISQGLVVRLQSYTQADEYTDPSPYPLIVELIFSTIHQSSYKNFKKGAPLQLSLTPHFASVLHAETKVRDDDDTILIITAISLGNKIRPPQSGPFDLKPPLEVNLQAKIPIFE